MTHILFLYFYYHFYYLIIFMHFFSSHFSFVRLHSTHYIYFMVSFFLLFPHAHTHIHTLQEYIATHTHTSTRTVFLSSFAQKTTLLLLLLYHII
ncbi:hypothetical protein BDA99DRAFT_515457 [Phascolomyces articulosus]|uniref:Uncharacterized protein n=1 Tax=Phascolomyces articulosus TaxID=60185 RepID=A0AAD5KA59_9FUNG|nr:hypothetical protein BDA99DRAFT_515457 [Phascolomyces articulosus]